MMLFVPPFYNSSMQFITTAQHVREVLLVLTERVYTKCLCLPTIKWRPESLSPSAEELNVNLSVVVGAGLDRREERVWEKASKPYIFPRELSRKNFPKSFRLFGTPLFFVQQAEPQLLRNRSAKKLLSLFIFCSDLFMDRNITRLLES